MLSWPRRKVEVENVRIKCPGEFSEWEIARWECTCIKCLKQGVFGRIIQWGKFMGRGLSGRMSRGKHQRVNVPIRMKDYKSVCATVMLCATLVNTQTAYDKGYTVSSAS